MNQRITDKLKSNNNNRRVVVNGQTIIKFNLGADNMSGDNNSFHAFLLAALSRKYCIQRFLHTTKILRFHELF